MAAKLEPQGHTVPDMSQDSLHDGKMSTEEAHSTEMPLGKIEEGTEQSNAEKGSGAPAAPSSQPAGGPSHVNDLSSIPNGGLQAWLQVAGAFCLFFNSWGIINTWGVYQTYYSLGPLQNTSPSTIAWTGSVQVFLLLFCGALSGPIYDAGYFRILLLVGSFLVVFGHMMLSLCTEFWQVLLAQGFCVGFGMAALFIPSVAILSTYFSTKIAMATGIAASGSSLGGVLYPIILYKLIPQIGFPWAVRTIGFISLATLLVPNLVMKVRILPPARRALIDMSAFKELPFMVFCLASFFAFFGLYQPFFFVQDFAITKNITTESIAFYLLSFLNAASVFGRIIPNIIADRVGPLNIIGPCAIITGILILCLIAVTSAGPLIAIVVLFGFFSGTLVSLPPTVIVHLTKDRRFIGTRLGMCFAFCSVGSLVSTPIGGALINKDNEFWSTWILGGVFSLAGGFGMLLTRGFAKGWGLFVKA